MATIIPLVEIDPMLVEQLLDAAFGAQRKARTAYKIREGASMLEGLSIAAVDPIAEELFGTLQCWPVALTDEEGTPHPMIMVGPVAVHPSCQNQGIGKQMMTAILQELKPEASLPLVMIGDPDYYGRLFDFSAERTGGWRVPGPWEPSRLLLRAAADAQLPEKGLLGPWQG